MGSLSTGKQVKSTSTSSTSSSSFSSNVKANKYLIIHIPYVREAPLLTA